MSTAQTPFSNASDIKVADSLQNIKMSRPNSDSRFSEKLAHLETSKSEEYNKKVAHQYETIKENEEFLHDETLLQAKIGICEKELKKVCREQKMKNIISTNLQLADTLQKIVGPIAKKKRALSCSPAERGYSENQENRIMDLLKRKKELIKQIRLQHKEIIDSKNNPQTPEVSDENVENQRGRLSNSNVERDGDSSVEDATTFKDLNVLREKCNGLHYRTQLLAWILKSLVTNLKSDSKQHILPVCEDIISGACHSPKGTEETLDKLESSDSCNTSG